MWITYSLSINAECLFQIILLICKITCAMNVTFQRQNCHILLYLLLFAIRLICYNYSSTSVLPSCCIILWLLHSCSTGVCSRFSVFVFFRLLRREVLLISCYSSAHLNLSLLLSGIHFSFLFCFSVQISIHIPHECVDIKRNSIVFN